MMYVLSVIDKVPLRGSEQTELLIFFDTGNSQLQNLVLLSGLFRICIMLLHCRLSPVTRSIFFATMLTDRDATHLQIKGDENCIGNISEDRQKLRVELVSIDLHLETICCTVLDEVEEEKTDERSEVEIKARQSITLTGRHVFQSSTNRSFLSCV
jgi:hypothetical protein